MIDVRESTQRKDFILYFLTNRRSLARIFNIQREKNDDFDLSSITHTPLVKSMSVVCRLNLDVSLYMQQTRNLENDLPTRQ